MPEILIKPLYVLTYMCRYHVVAAEPKIMPRFFVLPVAEYNYLFCTTKETGSPLVLNKPYITTLICLKWVFLSC
jgi:hypothetical protein